MACSGNVSFTLIGSQYVGVTAGGTLLVVECVGVGASGWRLTSTVGITSYIYSANPSSTCTPLSLSFSNVIIDCGTVNITLSANMGPCATSSAAPAGSSSSTGGGGSSGVTVINGPASGFYSAEGTTLVVECWGGGGGGTNGPSESSGGGGGGGGAYSKKTFTGVSLGASYAYQAATGGVVGSNGGDTYFDSATSVFAIGGDAGPGTPGSEYLGGAGGQASSGHGDLTRNGGNAGSSTASTLNGGGGGGGSPDEGGDGGDGVTASFTIVGGAGGVAGGAHGAAGGNGATVGAPPAGAGSYPGGGGGGGCTGVDPSDRLAGAGAAGLIRITWSN